MEQKLNTDWLAALLLCFFLGVFGAHQFFTGNKQKGIIMLLLTILLGWLGVGIIVTTVWAIYDLIMIICGKFTKADGKVITMYA